MPPKIVSINPINKLDSVTERSILCNQATPSEGQDFGVASLLKIQQALNQGPRLDQIPEAIRTKLYCDGCTVLLMHMQSYPSE